MRQVFHQVLLSYCYSIWLLYQTYLLYKRVKMRLHIGKNIKLGCFETICLFCHRSPYLCKCFGAISQIVDNSELKQTYFING